MPRGAFNHAGEKAKAALRRVQISPHLPVGGGADYSDYVDQAGSQQPQGI